MALTYRLEKGSRLTHEQLDENFRFLNSKVAEVAAKTDISLAQVSVVPLGGLAYAVRADSYYINEIYYTATPLTITLATADATFDRLDLIYADVTGNIGKITGVADASTAPPDYDPETQYFIRFILVKAGATTGTNPVTDVDITTETVYTDGIGETGEWTFSSNSATIVNAAGVINATNPLSSHKFKMTNDADVVGLDSDKDFSLSFDITLKAPLGNSYIFIKLLNASGVAMTASLLLNNGDYEFKASTLTTQNIVIKGSDFSFVSIGSFRQLEMFVLKSFLGYTIDNIKFHLGDASIAFPDVITDHTLLSNIGTNTHSQIDNHISNVTTNPHSVTKAQVGLSDVPNTDFTSAVSANTAKVSFPEAPIDGSSYARKDAGWVNLAGGGDMLKAVYDPTNKLGDAFDMVNMVEGATKKILTDTERTAISNNTAKVGFTAAGVLATVLTGISFLTGTAVVATDSILEAFGKLQKQITDLTTAVGLNTAKVTNATHTGEVIGSGALTIASGVVDRDNLHVSLKTRITNATTTGTYTLNHALGNDWKLTLTGITTIDESNLPTGTDTIEFTMKVTGNFGLTVPTYWTVLGDTYDGTIWNFFTVQIHKGDATQEATCFISNF